MPIQVDVEQRRTAIAEATFRVAARDGLGAVTIRSVAAELGASTTVITNYLPTRAELLANAIDRLADEWLAELDDMSTDREPGDALRRVMEAAVSWDDNELLRCQFWVAVLSEPNRTDEVQRQLIEAADSVRLVLEKLCEQCGHPEPAVAADVLFLFAQGAFASIVEAPTRWTADRMRGAARALATAVADC
jgi:AcrR family transcriptional regulator